MAAFPIMAWLSIVSEIFTAPRFMAATTTTDASTSSRLEHIKLLETQAASGTKKDGKIVIYQLT